MKSLGETCTIDATSSTSRAVRTIDRSMLPADRGVAQLANDANPRRALQTLGEQLFMALISGYGEELYRNCLNQALRTGAVLRVVLDVDSKLTSIPWEYLYDPHRGSFLARSHQTSLVRTIDCQHVTPSQLPIEQLRVLSMTASPTTRRQLNIADEQSQIAEALAPAIGAGMASLSFVAGGTLGELASALRCVRPHVFHFGGHSEWDPTSQTGSVVLADDRGFPRHVDSRTLGSLLHRPELRLAIFASCHGARFSSHDRFAGIATGLVAQGVPAAIGMQFRFGDAAAPCFSSTLLADLATGTPLDQAVTASRLAIMTSPSETEWGTPVLTTRIPIDHVLPRVTANRPVA